MILSIDCGTQSIRVVLINLNGEIVDKEQIYYEPYQKSELGWAEQDAEVYWMNLCKASLTLRNRNEDHYRAILGVGITALRSTMVNVDKDGNALRPIITWLDQRKSVNVFRPNIAWKLGLKTLGVYEKILKLERKGHSNWIMQNEPEIWKRTHKYIQVSAYLNFKLSGEFKDSIASQIGHIPFNYKKQRWAKSSDLIELSHKVYPIHPSKLPELVPPGKESGRITEKAEQLTGIKRETPIIACGSDKGCETLGMGVINTNTASLSFGTTATVQTTTNKYFEPMLFFPSYPAVIEDHWNPEVEIYRGFWMINWFKNEFASKEVQHAQKEGLTVEEVLNGLLHKSPPGAMGLIVQPYWSPGLGQKNAKGAMIGFSEKNKKEHIYRAVIEGLCYGLLEGMKRLERRGGFKFKSIAVSGGASQSDEICQIAADIFNMEIIRGRTHETSSLGAAIITAYGVGAYSSLNEATEKMVKYGKTFKPNQDNIELYKSMFEDVYLKMYGKLNPIYKRINEIIKYPEA